MPTPSDLFLSPDLTEAEARAYLQSLGFRDTAAVDQCLQQMADDLVVREALGRLATELIPALLESPDPDAAAINVAHYISARAGRAMLCDYLRDDPRALHVLTYVMGASPYLSEILIHTPEYFHWLVAQVERSAPDRQDHEEELVSAFATVDDPGEALNMLRRWKRRELLRIGTRDLLRHETVQTVSAQLSDVAAVAVDFVLAIVMQQRLNEEGQERAPGAFAIIGSGSLGSGEMSYGPDVDLLYVFESAGEGNDVEASRVFFERVGRDVTAALGEEDPREGMLYRVAARQWPQTGGELRACSLRECADHYARSDDVGERLALTRARPIAGDAQLGARFIAACQPFIYRERPDGRTIAALVGDREGEEVEALTQAFQLTHGAHHTPLRHTGTLGVLEALAKGGLLAEPVCRELDRAYVFLRSARHRRELGLADDLQKQIDSSRQRVKEICQSLSHV